MSKYDPSALIFAFNEAVVFDKNNKTAQMYANMDVDGDDQKQNNVVVLDRMYSLGMITLASHGFGKDALTQ